MIKTINVNYDDPKDLKATISALQNRRKKILRELGYNQVNFNGSKYNMENIYPIFDDILNTNIINVPDNNDNKIYYVYVHCDPRTILNVTNIKHIFLASKFGLKNEVIYVGKGTGERFKDLHRNDSHRKFRSLLIKNGRDLLPVKIAENLSEQEALGLESKLIDILGLKCLSKHGMLLNLDEGENAEERRKQYPDNTIIKKLLQKNGFCR